MTRTPDAALRSFIDRLDPKLQTLFRSVRTAMRKRLPRANELAYDYSHSVVIAYSPTERGIDGIVSIAARTDGVRLYFGNGPKLPDPTKRLRGSAKQTRYIELTSAKELAAPDIEALIAAAIDASPVALPSEGKGELIIRTDSTTKAARRR